MPSCCYADEYGELFSERQARRKARRFRRRGLRGSGRELVDGLAERGVAGARVLEVGGGVGELHVELLRRGARTAVNVELSPGWEVVAGRMLDELGLRARVERRVGDFVEASAELPDANVVLLHRVLCCYPDWRALLAATTARATRLVGITVPTDHVGSRVAVAAGNWLLRLQRRSFRGFVHPVGEVVAALERAGFALTADRRGLVWRTLVAERSPAVS